MQMRGGVGLKDADVPEYLIAELLGHANENITTGRYGEESQGVEARAGGRAAGLAGAARGSVPAREVRPVRRFFSSGPHDGLEGQGRSPRTPALRFVSTQVARDGAPWLSAPATPPLSRQP
jgi:hypothetical protein